MMICSDENDPEQAEQKKPFKCDKCGKRYRHSRDVEQHVKLKHSSKQNIVYGLHSMYINGDGVCEMNKCSLQ